MIAWFAAKNQFAGKIENHECDAERQVEASPDEEYFFFAEHELQTPSLYVFLLYKTQN